jgi:hypothetical protein
VDCIVPVSDVVQKYLDTFCVEWDCMVLLNRNKMVFFFPSRNTDQGV